MDQRAYWVGFNKIKGIGAVRTRLLIDHFGDLATAWHAGYQGLLSAGMSEKMAEKVHVATQSIDLERTWDQIQTRGIGVTTWLNEDYPRLLKTIDQPPPVLYFRGKLASLSDWAIAIVGTRRMTAYGRQVASDLATILASQGVTVVSGLAHGIDSAAHSAALDANGVTYSVLGSGVDIIYPHENEKLAERIMLTGAVISEYAPGTPPDSVNFPPRNRIISGLAQATVVVEAGDSSGALITAEFAANQGREVFAVPGNILGSQSRGCNRLIRDGARILVNPNDILDFLRMEKVEEQHLEHSFVPADDVEAAILRILEPEDMDVDEIRTGTGIPIEKLSSTLTMMELKGMICQTEGLRYSLIKDTLVPYQVKNG
jgi:DNA processing protein